MALLIYMVSVFALLPEYQVSADMRTAEYESDPDSDWIDQLDELISEKTPVLMRVIDLVVKIVEGYVFF